MTILKKFATVAAASTLALGLGTSANAAVELFQNADAGGVGILNTADQFQIINSRIDPLGSLNPDTNTTSFQVGSNVSDVFLDFGVIQSNPDLDQLSRGIQNLMLSVEGDMGTDVTFQITDADGFLLLDSLQSFGVMADETLTFLFSGTAFGGQGSRPSFDVGIFGDEAINPIPLPGAAVFFLTAAGAGALRMRKKAA